MYFDFEDYHPEFTPVGHAISTREGVLIAFILHLLAIIVILVGPRFLPDTASAARARALLLAQQRRAQPPRFVFVQPRIDTPALRPPLRSELSDLDRQARTPEKGPKPTNPLPYSRGNTSERVDVPREAERKPREAQQQQSPAATPQTGQQAQAEPPKLPDLPNRMQVPALPSRQAAAAPSPGGRIMQDAIEHFDRHIPRQFDNPGGGSQQIGPLQFDTKGVEFGPWVRRFVAQIRRNWNIPEAAYFSKGHVVITFYVHKDGALTDINVVGACPIDSFNTAAYGALSWSNPTEPLPPQYPSDKAFFTVTFFYNEQPPSSQ
jgi:outer membrane biosynthesis protein TonB